MLLVQKYLMSGKTLDDLQSEHGVKHHVTNGKVVLNYDQIEARDSDPLSQQCRGLVLRERDWSVVACPMFRFFNKEQEAIAAEIDWNTAQYEEKMDGSCIIVYYDEDQYKWCCGTRGRCEADADAHDAGMTFSQLVESAINWMVARAGAFTFDKVTLSGFMEKGGADKNKTYVFELTSPLNRIVCKYDNFTLTLLAVRDNRSLKESDPRDHVGGFEFFGLKTPEIYEFNNVNHLIQVIRDWSPEDHEGIVVKDAQFNRIKVKNPAYVAFNHLNQSLSTSLRGCIEVILVGKDDDVIPMMPDFIANRIRKLKSAVQEVLARTQKDFDELKDIDDMKTYALEAQKRLWPGALFALKRGKTPDLKTFALGNKEDVSKIPSTATNSMLALCRKIDPDIAKLEI